MRLYVAYRLWWTFARLPPERSITVIDCKQTFFFTQAIYFAIAAIEPFCRVLFRSVQIHSYHAKQWVRSKFSTDRFKGFPKRTWDHFLIRTITRNRLRSDWICCKNFAKIHVNLWLRYDHNSHFFCPAMCVFLVLPKFLTATDNCQSTIRSCSFTLYDRALSAIKRN